MIMHSLEASVVGKFYESKQYLNKEAHIIITDINKKIIGCLNNYDFLDNISYWGFRTQFNLHLPQLPLEILYKNIDEINDIDDLRKGIINESAVDGIIHLIKPRLMKTLSSYEYLYDKENLQKSYVNSKIIFECWRSFIVKNNLITEELLFWEVEKDMGLFIQEKLHYINNSREDTLLHLWFKNSNGEVLAYCSFSVLDRDYPLLAFREGVLKEEILNMTKAFCIDSAPANLMSALYHKSHQYIKNKYPQFQYIMTYVNQNLLFHWSSFKGSSYITKWLSPMKYLYVNGVYKNRKGIKQDDLVEENKLEVLPIVLLARGLNKKTEKEIENTDWVVIISKNMYAKW